jgi:hypothetical protein
VDINLQPAMDAARRIATSQAGRMAGDAANWGGRQLGVGELLRGTGQPVSAQ